VNNRTKGEGWFLIKNQRGPNHISEIPYQKSEIGQKSWLKIDFFTKLTHATRSKPRRHTSAAKLVWLSVMTSTLWANSGRRLVPRPTLVNLLDCVRRHLRGETLRKQQSTVARISCMGFVCHAAGFRCENTCKLHSEMVLLLHIRLRIFFCSHCHRGERSVENVNLP